jgi:pimeloyl-ACP methyl ester carboxylesterase
MTDRAKARPPDPPSWVLDVRGLPLHVWELGTPPARAEDGVSESAQALPIVCLHGWLDQGLAFARVAMGRAERWVAPDQRGFGRSGHVGAGGWYHFANYLMDLDALVRALGGRVHLVGHSMGGTVACYYAGARPDRVRSLTVIEGMGALATAETSMLSRTREFLDGLENPPNRIRLASLEAASRRLQQRHPALTDEHATLLARHGTEVLPDGKVRWRFDPQHLVRSPTPFLEVAFLEFVRAITAPTLLVWATESWYPSEVQERRGAAFASPRIERIPGSHMLPYDAPETLTRLVIEHVARAR